MITESHSEKWHTCVGPRDLKHWFPGEAPDTVIVSVHCRVSFSFISLMAGQCSHQQAGGVVSLPSITRTNTAAEVLFGPFKDMHCHFAQFSSGLHLCLSSLPLSINLNNLHF